MGEGTAWVEAPAFMPGRTSTERKQAEEALRLSEERFTKAFHASPEPIAIYRQLDSTLLEVNERWTSTYGYTRAEAIGRTAWDLQLIKLEDRQKV
jgi:PAS domain-containing protein